MHDEAINPAILSHGWIGQPIGSATVARVMGVSLVASITMQVEPMLLTALAHHGQFALAQIGKIATTEFAATGVVTAFAVARLPYDRVRLMTAAAALLSAIANAIIATGPSLTVIFATRLASGCASGIFMWAIIGVLTRSTLPARLNGIYLALQGGVSLAMAALFGSIILPHFGASGAFAVLAGFGLAATFAALGLPMVFDPSRLAEVGSATPPFRGWLALLAILVSMAAVLSIWVHFPPLARQLGYPDWAERVAVPFAIGMEVVGGLAAAAMAARPAWLRILQVNLLLLIVAAAVLSLVHSPVLYVAAAGMVGMLWMFTAPFQFPLSLAADPSRRTLPFVSPAQLIGSGIGPAIASFGVMHGDVRGAMLIAGVMVLVSLVLMAAVTRSPRLAVG